VEQAIHTSLRRMGVETLELLQFHWWYYRGVRPQNILYCGL